MPKAIVEIRDLTQGNRKSGKGKSCPFEVAEVGLGEHWEAMSEAEIEKSLQVRARFQCYGEALAYAEDLARRPQCWAPAILIRR